MNAAAARRSKRGASDENMKPLLHSHFHIKSKRGPGELKQAGRGGFPLYRLPHRTVVYYAHTANVVIANGRETHGIPYAVAVCKMLQTDAKQIRNPSEFLTPSRRYDK